MTVTQSRVERRALPQAELAALTNRYAAEVRAGRHPIQVDPINRWHVRLYADDEVDVWLISWTTDQRTELHDHGGSSGAFTVVEGVLTESVWSAGALVDLRRDAEETVTFSEHYIHDVRNQDEPVAVSVHAYSPPLTLMRFYGVREGEIVQQDQLWTDDPEAPAPTRSHPADELPQR